MNRVSDLTTDAIGKIYRIQNDDGAYIEGTLEAVTFGVVGESKVPEVIVSFRELKTSYRENAKRTAIPIYTRPQHSAVEVTELEYGPGDSFGATRGPGVNGKLFPERKKD